MLKHIGLRICGYLSALFMVGILVAVHEAGHLVAAKFFGVAVSKVQVGIGPSYVLFTSGQTDYAVGALPLGGFAEIVMHPEQAKARGLTLPAGSTLSEASTAARVITLGAGIVFNLIAASVLLRLSNCLYVSDVKESLREWRMVAWTESVEKMSYPRKKFLGIIGGPLFILAKSSVPPFVGRGATLMNLGFLSRGLAEMNLLPIVPLDGGRIVDAVFLQSAMSGGSATEAFDLPIAYLIPILVLLMIFVIISFRDIYSVIRFERMLYKDCKRLGGMLAIRNAAPDAVARRRVRHFALGHKLYES